MHTPKTERERLLLALVNGAPSLMCISPPTALTLVNLGVDLAGLTIMGTLAGGISYALRR